MSRDRLADAVVRLDAVRVADSSGAVGSQRARCSRAVVEALRAPLGAPVRVTQTDPMWPEIFDRGDGGAPRTGAGEAVADSDFGSAEGIASMVNLAARVDPADAGTSFDPSRAWFGPADDPPTP